MKSGGKSKEFLILKNGGKDGKNIRYGKKSIYL